MNFIFDNLQKIVNKYLNIISLVGIEKIREDKLLLILL